MNQSTLNAKARMQRAADELDEAAEEVAQANYRLQVAREAYHQAHEDYCELLP